MKIHDVQQNSLEWLALRAGRPTASEFDNLVTPEWKIRTGAMPASYLAKKVAEAWLGGPLPDFSSFDTEQGNILEDEAKPWYSLEYDEEITDVGFITTDDGRVGCSPDGLIGDEGGIEIKCPSANVHVGYVLNGTLPKEYILQVHGALFVTNRPWWRFVAYRRAFPPLVLTVHRDEKIDKIVAQALSEFLERFDAAMAKLEKANGGPPRRRKIYVPTPELEPIGVTP